jgi:hypothetical protein
MVFYLDPVMPVWSDCQWTEDNPIGLNVLSSCWQDCWHQLSLKLHHQRLAGHEVEIGLKD